MRTLAKMWHSAGRQKSLGSHAGATYLVMMGTMMILIGLAVTVRDSAVVTGVLSDGKTVAGNHLLDNGDAARSTTGHFAFSSGLSKKKQQVKRFSAYFSALARERRAVSSFKAEKSSYVPVDNLSSADLFIAVKTTGKYHRTRLELLLDTWISKNTQQTYIFTDAEDEHLRKRMGGHLINSNCSSAHSRQALSCKMALEYSAFIASGNKWFCHVDDDNYVNVRPLVRLLSHYNHRDDLYVGRPSLDRPIEATERLSPSQAKPVRFWFATGGAGFCISRGLALKMAPWASGGKFMSTAERIRLPDDCTVGYIIEGLLGVRLVRSPLFHSHLESLGLVSDIYNQVTLSYSMVESQRNTVTLRGVFSFEDDPTRFRSVHCLLYPDTPWCPS